MAITGSFTKEKLMCGILYHDPILLDQVLDSLKSRFGLLDFQSPPVSFDFSNYYDDEIGGPIKRIFISFQTLVDPSRLADIKIATNALEQQIACNGKRPVNIDPGLVSLGKLILATTKSASHRIALKDGIYAEITLFYSRKIFQSLPWTYPDFNSEQVKEQMRTVRTLYYQQFKAGEA